MKKILLKFVSCFVLFDVMYASLLDTKTINIEMMIVDQVDKQLEGILTKEQYSILVDVDLSVSQKKKIVMGEVESRLYLPVDKGRKTVLPGFDIYDDEAVKKAEGSEIEKKEQYIYEDEHKIDSVYVQLILATSLAESKKTLVKNIVTDGIRKKFGYKAIIKLREVELLEKKDKLSWPENLRVFINRNIEFLSLIFILSLLLLIFSFFLLRRKATKGKDKLTQSIPDDDENKSFLDSGKSGAGLLHSEVLKKIIEHIKASPLISRSCLQSLPVESRLAVVESIGDRVIKNAFFHMLKLKQEDRLLGGMTKDILVEKNQEVLEKLENSQDMQNLILEQRFGYLNLLTAEETLKFLTGFDAQEIAIILRHIKESKHSYLIKKLSKQMRIDILRHLNKDNIYDVKEEKDVDIKLRQKILDFYRKIFTKDIANAPMAAAVLECDPNIEETLKVLQDDPSFDFKEEYKVFLISYKEALKDWDNAIEVFYDLENEDVAVLLKKIDEDTTNRILETFPEMRRQLISKQIPSEQNFEEVFEKAKTRFMRMYRQVYKRGKK
jgi:hypothetical protein